MPDLAFELPVEPGYREQPPSGTIEDGIRLSLAALELVKDRPEIFVAREAQRVTVEFVL
jgi:hypothetical protein